MQHLATLTFALLGSDSGTAGPHPVPHPNAAQWIREGVSAALHKTIVQNTHLVDQSSLWLSWKSVGLIGTLYDCVLRHGYPKVASSSLARDNQSALLFGSLSASVIF
ncbi:hypothetical protein LX36DRAFT_374117 [Colletotrichum falcatum]|nr:hypothetical protein LX36DRAFT_374117 [Colletotrichum falcatum]